LQKQKECLMKKNDKIKDIVLQYEKEDRYFMVHENDPDLKPVKILLPEAPNSELIAGHGLNPEDQKFRYVKMPDDIEAIENQALKELQTT